MIFNVHQLFKKPKNPTSIQGNQKFSNKKLDFIDEPPPQTISICIQGKIVYNIYLKSKFI